MIRIADELRVRCADDSISDQYTDDYKWSSRLFVTLFLNLDKDDEYIEGKCNDH